ncbi:unnamed protein product [Paramecium octaurelia]|uniref:Uncharacterized protein n=1 Tax=Paramecium octaurelia TaxID=43137 RepID=A0A8S1S4U5_PAROT|nr:unnamed protein product [Paramecium octaurelia]
MKPSRIPVRAFGNAVYQQPIEQRQLRPSSTQQTMEPRQIMRCVSQEQKLPYQPLQYVQYPQQRGSNPPIRKPLQETVAYYPQQQQYQQCVPLKTEQQNKTSLIQELSKVQSQAQLNLAQQDDTNQSAIIKQQNEQIQQLQTQLSEKVHQYQQLQERFNVEFRKFQEDIRYKLTNIDLNISQNDYTQQFMLEIDRKVSNLQSNLNEQFKELQDNFEQKTKQSEHLVKNLSSNISLRLNEDEQHFKQEIENLNSKLNSKADRQKVEQTIQVQITSLQNQYQLQLQQAHQLLNKINNEKSDELLQIKNQIQNTLMHLTQQVNQKLQHMYDTINERDQDNNNNKQESKQLSQHFTNLTNKFKQLQQQSVETITQLKQKNKQIEKEKQELNKQLTQQQFLVSQFQSEITKLKNTNSQLTLQLSPQVKQNSFFSTSTAVAIGKQKSKKQLSIVKKKNEISLDDFADFNENSLLDSNDSFEINETCGFSKTKKNAQIEEFQSPPRNPFKKSQIQNNNKILCEDISGQVSCKSRGKSAPLPLVNALTKAIKRRLLYLGKNDRILTCTYDSEKHLIDCDMGLCLLDENGSPFVVSEQEKAQLIQMKLIKIN